MGGICSRREVSLAICSRDSEENYGWLQDLLEKRMFGNMEVTVHPVYISNNANEFYRAAVCHDFAILYHTKRRGRINLTNVTDSLYDEELRYLHDKLGKKKVVVVIDDLQKSDDEEKSRIQEGQQDLRNHACNLFLFSEADKKNIGEQGMGSGEVAKKLKDLKKDIKTGGKDAKSENNIKKSRKTYPADNHQ